MRRHPPLQFALAAIAACTLAASTALAQHVEVPSFTVGLTVEDYGLESSDVAAGDDGSFVAVWHEYLTTDHTAPLPRAVVTRRATPLGPTGLAHRTEGNINTVRAPTIASIAGGYLAAWIHHDNGARMLGARLDESGAGIEDQFEITDAAGVEWLGREVAAAGIGIGAVVFWYESLRSPVAVTQHVVARLYDLESNPRGPSVEVGAGIPDPYLDVVRLADGGFMVGWGGQIGGNARAFGRSYLSDGQPRGPQFDFSTASQFRRLAVSPDGATVAMIGVRSPGGPIPREIWARRFAIDGTPLAPEFLVHATAPEIAVRPDAAFDLAGNLYVTWAEALSGTRARGFDPNDVPFGPPITVSTAATLDIRTDRLTSGSFVNVTSYFGTDFVQATVVSLCTPGTSVCGDGAIDARCELCDDAGANSDVTPDACRTNCRPAGCGDGVIDGGETCDDGNREDCDGCSASCAVEAGIGCGDGVPYPACGELCDDGNAVAGDGCSPTCALERVPGGGSSTTECYTEWSVENPANDPLLEKGKFRRTQTCTDGDSRCDFDGAAGTCTFHIRQCANNTDIPGCTAGSRLSSWQLRAPSTSQAAKLPVVAAARAALAGTIPSTIVGPSARDVCSPAAAVPVGLRGSAGAYRVGKLVLKTIATQYDGTRDTDMLKLICLPATP